MEAQRDGRPVPAEAAGSGGLDPDRVLFLVEDEDPPTAATSVLNSPRHRLADRVALDLCEPPGEGRRNEADTASMSVALDEMPELVCRA